MSLAEGDNPRTNRDAQLDLSRRIGKEYGENVFIDDHNEQQYTRVLFHDRGGLDRRPKCCAGRERKKVRDCFPDYDKWLDKKIKGE